MWPMAPISLFGSHRGSNPSKLRRVYEAGDRTLLFPAKLQTQAAGPRRLGSTSRGSADVGLPRSSPTAGLGTQPGQYLPVWIHEREQYLRTAPNLECGRARKDHAGRLIQRQVVRPPQREPNERAHIMRRRDEYRAGGRNDVRPIRKFMISASEASVRGCLNAAGKTTIAENAASIAERNAGTHGVRLARVPTRQARRAAPPGFSTRRSPVFAARQGTHVPTDEAGGDTMVQAFDQNPHHDGDAERGGHPSKVRSSTRADMGRANQSINASDTQAVPSTPGNVQPDTSNSAQSGPHFSSRHTCEREGKQHRADEDGDPHPSPGLALHQYCDRADETAGERDRQSGSSHERGGPAELSYPLVRHGDRGEPQADEWLRVDVPIANRPELQEKNCERSRTTSNHGASMTVRICDTPGRWTATTEMARVANTIPIAPMTPTPRGSHRQTSKSNPGSAISGWITSAPSARHRPSRFLPRNLTGKGGNDQCFGRQACC